MRWSSSLVLVAWLSSACSAVQSSAESREDFCERWGDAACSEEFVSACVSPDADACKLGQQRLCLDLVPVTGFVDDRADACIDAVKKAYSDADLTATELDAVLRLGPPCDRLVRGPKATGESCTARLDCDAPGGYACVFKGNSVSGTCEKPVVVQPGRDCSAAGATCTDGFYCDGNNCIEISVAGDACARNDQCSGGYCGAGNVCVAGLDSDQPCTRDEECAAGVCYRFSPGEQVCTDRVRLSRTDPLCEASR